jgi:hypothetical protein
MSAILVLSVCLAAPAWMPVLSEPTLSLAGAPRLGHPVELRIGSPQPQAQAFLLASPLAGSLALPFGTLELAPAGLVLLAAGSTGAGAVLALSFPTQSTAAAAEAEVHAQAVVLDPATATLSVTNALHFRLRSSRAYVATRAGTSTPSRLQVYSTTNHALVYTRQDPILADEVASTAGDDELPLVAASSDGLRAACVNDVPALVIFDDSFGTTLHEIPLVSPARQLALAADGSAVHVLQTAPGLLSRVDFATGAITAALALPFAASAAWTVSADRRTAYIAAAPGSDGAARVLRVDLDAFQVVDAIEVYPAQSGSGGAAIRDLAAEGSRVVTVGTVLGAAGPPLHGFAATIEYATQPPSLAQVSEPTADWFDLLVAPELGSAIFVRGLNFLYGISFYGFPIANPAAFAPFAPSHPFSSSGAPVLQYDGQRVWVLNDDNYDSNYQVFELDLATWVWKQHWAPGMCYPGPFDFARVRDVHSDLLLQLVDNHPLACPAYAGQLVMMDVATSATLALHSLGGRPVWLESIEVDGL